jgi:hypothetical protein
MRPARATSPLVLIGERHCPARTALRRGQAGAGGRSPTNPALHREGHGENRRGPSAKARMSKGALRPRSVRSPGRARRLRRPPPAPGRYWPAERTPMIKWISRDAAASLGSEQGRDSHSPGLAGRAAPAIPGRHGHAPLAARPTLAGAKRGARTDRRTRSATEWHRCACVGRRMGNQCQSQRRGVWREAGPRRSRADSGHHGEGRDGPSLNAHMAMPRRQPPTAHALRRAEDGSGVPQRSRAAAAAAHFLSAIERSWRSVRKPQA